MKGQEGRNKVKVYDDISMGVKMDWWASGAILRDVMRTK